MQPMLRRALARYEEALLASPYRTKALTASCISACGDTMVQLSTSPADSELDRVRTARQAFWSLSVSPVMHNWFRLLDHVRPIGPVPASVVSVVLDQLFFSPPVHCVYFSWIASASSGFTLSVSEIKDKVSEKLLPALTASLAIWPAAIYFTVTHVPLPYRVLSTNIVGLGYGMLMSWMANSHREEPVPIAEPAGRLKRSDSGMHR